MHSVEFILSCFFYARDPPESHQSNLRPRKKDVHSEDRLEDLVYFYTYYRLPGRCSPESKTHRKRVVSIVGAHCRISRPDYRAEHSAPTGEPRMSLPLPRTGTTRSAKLRGKPVSRRVASCSAPSDAWTWFAAQSSSAKQHYYGIRLEGNQQTR